MTSAYIAGFVKTAVALNVRNPLGMLVQARGLLSRGMGAARARFGDKSVDAAVGAGRDFLRARNAMLPLAAVPAVTT